MVSIRVSEKDAAELHLMELYGLVGTIATAWSTLEYTIDSCLCGLADARGDAGMCLTSQIESARKKLLTMEALLELRGAPIELIRDVRRFMNDLVPFTEKRNRAVHDILMISQGSEAPVFHRRYVNRKFIYEAQPVTAETLRDIQQDILKVQVSFNGLMNRTMPFWPPLREIPPAQPPDIPLGHHPEERNP